MIMSSGAVLDRHLPRNAAIRVLDSGGHGAFGDLYLSTGLMRFVAASPDVPRLIRAYRPEPTVAFSRRESLLPGFESALTAAAIYGFTPVIRPTGGRAVSLDPSCLLIDVIEPVSRRYEGHRAAFRGVAEALASGLRSLDVDAFVGEVPGEYCPGEFSVNARREVKIVGISQRVIRGARLVSAMIAVEEPGVLPDLLAEVYRELAFPWRTETFGSVSREAAAVSFAQVSSALQEALCPDGAAEITYHEFAAQYRSLLGP